MRRRPHTWREGGYPADGAQQEYRIFMDGLPGVKQAKVRAGTLAEELHDRLAAFAGQAKGSFYLLARDQRLSAQGSMAAAGTERDCTVRAQGRLRGGATRPGPWDGRASGATSLQPSQGVLWSCQLQPAGAAQAEGEEARAAGRDAAGATQLAAAFAGAATPRPTHGAGSLEEPAQGHEGPRAVVAALRVELFRTQLRDRQQEGDLLARAGGRPAQAQQGRSATQLAAEAQTTPMAGPGDLVSPEDPLEVEEQVRGYTCDKLAGRLAESAATGYQREWERRLWACRSRGAAPRLGGATAAERLDEEDRVLAYLGYLAWLGKPGSAWRSATMAIQAGHRRAAAGDTSEEPRCRRLCTTHKGWGGWRARVRRDRLGNVDGQKERDPAAAAGLAQHQLHRGHFDPS